MYLNKIIEKVKNLFPKKNQDTEKENRNKELLEKYNQGRILQVDNKKDNKEYFKSLENKK